MWTKRNRCTLSNDKSFSLPLGLGFPSVYLSLALSISLFSLAFNWIADLLQIVARIWWLTLLLPFYGRHRRTAQPLPQTEPLSLNAILFAHLLSGTTGTLLKLLKLLTLPRTALLFPSRYIMFAVHGTLFHIRGFCVRCCKIANVAGFLACSGLLSFANESVSCSDIPKRTLAVCWR